jgi:aspartyl aminopeptidase
MPVADETAALRAYLDASPSPYHAVAEAIVRLEAAGFTELDETEAWGSSVGRRYVARGGSLVAWALDEPGQVDDGFRMIGAHTDSPNLRVKPRPDTGRAGYRQLAVEVYGGVLLNSWLDRDLGLSGRVAVRRGEATTSIELVKLDQPLLRIPQLAIHLDRGVNESGLILNPQQHLSPVWGLGPVDEGGLRAMVAEQLGIAPVDVLSWDLMLHDLTPAALLGRRGDLLSSARLDNLLSSFAAIDALVRTTTTAGAPPIGVPLICLFDHEEIGSETATGAAGAMLTTVCERVAGAAAPEGDPSSASRDRYLRALARSRCVSADGAHATHPNYAERHEPGHHIAMNQGPVIKVNSNMRYATDATTSAWFKLVCERAGAPVQEFVVRSDMGCGSTIGPLTSARLGIATVDVGVAQLSMHSAREICGAHDPEHFTRALAELLSGS